MLGRAVALASILLALWLVPTTAHSATTEDDFVQSAQEYYAKGDVPAALIELKNALQANPNNGAARVLLGRMRLDRGDYPGAETELSRAWQLGLRTEDLQLLLARARLGLGDFSGVLDVTQVGPDLSSPSAQSLLITRGEALLGLGRTGEAAKSFQDVLNVTPLAPAYAGLAQVAFANGQVEDSLQFVAKALSVDPKNSGWQALAGNIDAAVGRTTEAAAAFSSALELDPKNPDALVGMSKLKLIAKDYAGAKDYVDRALAAVGNRASVVVLKAYIELALQNYSLAHSLAEAVLAGDSENVTALYVSGTAKFGLNDLEQARSRLTQYLKKVPGDPSARAILDFLDQTQKSGATQQDQAAATNETRKTLLGLVSTQALSAGAAQTGGRNLESMVTQTGDSPRLRAQLSIYRSQQGDLARAEDELSQAIQLDKDQRFAGEIDRAEAALIIAHIQNRDFDKAIQLATAYRDRSPNSATPYTLLSLAYAAQDDKAKALDAVKEAQEKNPNAPALMNNYAVLQARLGDTKGAIETLKASAAKNPNDYSTLLQLASLLLGAGDPEQAIAWAEKALTADAKAVEPRVIMARSYIAQRNYEKALEATQGLAADNAGNAALLEAIGDAQFNLGHTADAVKTYEALVNAAPYSGTAYFYLARSYMANKQDDRVLPTLQKALAIDPENYQARVVYARYMLAKGNTEQAAPLIDSLAKQYQDNPEIQELAGQLAVAKGDYAGAVTELTAARDGYAKGGIHRPSTTSDLARALWLKGDQAGALAEMESWLSRNPDDTDMRLQLATLQTQTGQVEAAVQQYAKVIEAQPSNWIAQNDFAMLLYGKKDYAEARKHAEAAYQQAGTNPAVMDTLGAILLAQKQLDEALPLLEKANQAAPYQPDIAMHLSEAYEQSGRKADARSVLEQVLAKLGQFQGRAELEQRYKELSD